VSIDQKKYWFPAKRYGWGWGLPSAWQGWVVLILFIMLMAFGAVLFPPDRHGISYGLFVCLCSLLLFVVCWWKGEPPRWRWGGR
jgi:hypothetical protein